MKIAVAQRNFTVGDLEGNKSKIIESIDRARREKADLVVFAEYAVSGTPCYDLLRQAPFLEACEEASEQIAEHCAGICALVGMPVQDRNNVMSGAAFIRNGRVAKYIWKNAPESKYIEVAGMKIAVALGDDLMSERAFAEQTDMIVTLNSSEFARGRIERRHLRCVSFSFRQGKPLVGVNQLGGQADLVFDGTSLAYDGQGRLITMLASFEEDFAVIDTDDPGRIEFPVQDRTKNTFNAIKLGLRDFFTKNGFAKACLGMSGGIDSAVVLAIAAEVLAPKDIKLLMLPSQFSSAHSVDDSVEMAEKLGVEYEIIPIEPAFNAVTGSLAPIFAGTTFDTTEENIQSRLRGLMLMALSNKQGHILLNTSNKSEAAVGYGTLYGDMAGALGPIADLYKVEVYDLARHINREREIIPRNIISKAPSAELRPDQKDSDSLPPYETMDAILTRIVDEGHSLDEIIDAGFDFDTVHRIAGMLQRAEFKRRQSAPALRLSPRPFASDYVLPLINKFVL